jgi:hypothetical protein
MNQRAINNFEIKLLIDETDYRIDLTGLRNGMYFVRIVNGKEVFNEKVIKID